MISEAAARALLEQHDQIQVFRFWERLESHQQKKLLDQVSRLDFDSISRMRSLLSEHCASTQIEDIEPSPVVELEGDKRAAAVRHGEALLRESGAGVVIVAGGQGSRLGFEGPKGAYRIGPISDASLFQIHAHKVRAIERKYKAQVPVYLMTSLSNDRETRNVFEQHNFFGLSRDRVHFFTQGMWPALTEDGHIILEKPDEIFMSPDGHGGIVSAMLKEGVFADMQARGVSTLHYMQVDNPLVEIADPAFVGFHHMQNADVTVKVCAKRDANEPIGVVVLRGGRNTVVEYTELTESQKHETLPNGALRFRYGSVAIHVFRREFLEAQAEADLLIHVAHKKVPFCDEQGKTVVPAEPNAFKFEKFIFDVIPCAERSVNVAFAREDEFSPVKNRDGEDSPATSKRDMILKHARWLDQCGVNVPRGESGDPMFQVEIDPLFAMDADDLRTQLPEDFEINGDLYLS